MAAAGMLGTLGGAMRLRFDPMTGQITGLTADQAKGMEEAYQRILQETREALRTNAHVVNALVELLLEKEELLADDVRAFFDQYGLFTPDPMINIDTEELGLLDEPPRPELPLGLQDKVG